MLMTIAHQCVIKITNELVALEILDSMVVVIAHYWKKVNVVHFLIAGHINGQSITAIETME